MSEQPKELKIGRFTIKLSNNQDNNNQQQQKKFPNNNQPDNKKQQDFPDKQDTYKKESRDKDRDRAERGERPDRERGERFKEKDNRHHRENKEYYDNHHYKNKYINNKSHSRGSSHNNNKKNYSRSRSHSKSQSHSYPRKEKKYQNKHFNGGHQQQPYYNNQSIKHSSNNQNYNDKQRNKKISPNYPPNQNNKNNNNNNTNNMDNLTMKLIQSKKEELLNQQQQQYNQNNKNYQQYSDMNTNQHVTQPKEPSNTIMLSNMGPDINRDILEDIFREKCLDFQTSMPEEIRVIEELKMAYIIFPSVSSCIQVFEALKGKILINGNFYDLSYTPNIIQHNKQESVTYVTHLTDSNSLTTSMETIVHEDWYCEYCDCKNFSRRTLCFKCKRPKTLNCRIAPVIKQKTTIIGEHGVIPPNTSLMIRGNCLKTSNEGELLEHFSKYGQIKDVRMVRDHLSENSYRDYAFIEYFSIKESTNALEQMKEKPLYIRGDIIYAAYSKIKREDYSNIPVNQQAQINTSILTTEEKEKLNNITMLQNICEQNKSEKNKETNKKVNVVSTSNVDDVNIRREVTQREKVELEMKKWAKKTEKLNNINLALKNLNQNPQQTEIIINRNFNQPNDNNTDNLYDNVISLDTMTAKTKTDIHNNNSNNNMNMYNNNNINSNNTNINNSNNIINNNNMSINNNNNNVPNPSAINTTFICYICQRKFLTEEKLKNHEKLSELHKKNLAKLQEGQQQQSKE